VPSGGVTAGIADGATAAVRIAGAAETGGSEEELTWPTGGRACDVTGVLGAAMALPDFWIEAVLVVSFAPDDANGLPNGLSPKRIVSELQAANPPARPLTRSRRATDCSNAGRKRIPMF
jgi:hypothetical protein